VAGSFYWTRHKRYSIVALVICNERKQIINYQVGWPGSVGDSRCFSNSVIGRDPQRFIPNNQYILGDSAFPLKKYLLTPFTLPAANIPENSAFNERFSSVVHEVKQVG
jgi:hypothetical protein